MTTRARHLLASLAALALLAAGCTSATAGSGIGAATPSAGASGFAGTGGAGSPAPTGGGGPGAAGTAAFCAEYEAGTPNLDFGKLDGGALQRLVAHYDRLYALAPPAIKADVKVIDDYVHALAGNTPPADAAGFTDAYTNLITWAVQNCT